MRRVRAVGVGWRRRSDYTQWRLRVERGIGWTGYYFGTLHVNIEQEVGTFDFPTPMADSKPTRPSPSTPTQGVDTTEGDA